MKAVYDTFRSRSLSLILKRLRIENQWFIVSRYKLNIKRRFAQYKQETALFRNGVNYRDINAKLIPARNLRVLRFSVASIAQLTSSSIEERMKKELFLPFLKKTSLKFNLLRCVRDFAIQMYKIQARLKDRVNSNRAKLNYLTFIWEQRKEILYFDKKKDLNLIGQL